MFNVCAAPNAIDTTPRINLFDLHNDCIGIIINFLTIFDHWIFSNINCFSRQFVQNVKKFMYTFFFFFFFLKLFEIFLGLNEKKNCIEDSKDKKKFEKLIDKFYPPEKWIIYTLEPAPLVIPNWGLYHEPYTIQTFTTFSRQRKFDNLYDCAKYYSDGHLYLLSCFCFLIIEKNF